VYWHDILEVICEVHSFSVVRRRLGVRGEGNSWFSGKLLTFSSPAWGKREREKREKTNDVSLNP
jgi:hypothetical protein